MLLLFDYDGAIAQDRIADYGGTAHKYCIFTSRGVRLALVKSNELGISGANGVL